jgi:3-oxoacyl-[acyl-carrier-protein] synthase III
MPYLRGFGCYLPARIAGNDEVAALVGVEAEWLLKSTGIEERRFAAPGETVASLGTLAARDCLERTGIAQSEIGLILAASGSAERRFPGPAGAIGAALGIPGVPCIDLPLASAGSLFAMSLAARLCGDYGNVLVVASEIMSRVVRMDPSGRDTAILFGDGAGACVVGAATGFASIEDSLLASDGEMAGILTLELDAPIHMDGRSVILQAARKLPRVISDLLGRNQRRPEEIGAFILHQANRNLIVRVAQALGVPEAKFFQNVGRYGNTSSASMLIAAAEWWSATGELEAPVVFAAFGAGLNWGALLATAHTPAG